jgi:membrane fusion protein (multidrug efflux system)
MSRRPRPRFVLLTALTLLLSACGGGEKGAGGPGRAQARYVVDVIEVRAAPLTDRLSTTGTLLPREAVTLQAEISGIVREVTFEEAQPVEAGTPLVLIDDSELQAQRASAAAELELRRALERRQRELLEAKAISEVEYEESLATLHIAEAGLRRVEALLAKTRIVAPFAGVPGLRQVSPGAYLTPGTTITQFRDVSALKLDFSVPERYLPFLRTGTRVQFRVAGHSDPFEATLTAIDPGIDRATRSALLRAELPNPGARLLPGAFAEVDVALREIPDAILVPAIALIPGLKTQLVYVAIDGRAREREVSVGLRTAEGVQVTEGLRPGDLLITSGVLQLRDGLEVETRRIDTAGQPGETQPAPAARVGS